MGELGSGVVLRGRVVVIESRGGEEKLREGEKDVGVWQWQWLDESWEKGMVMGTASL